MKVGITGHRPDKFNKDYAMSSPWVKKIYNKLLSHISFKKPTEMWSGMALGIDMMWAELAITEGIPLVAVIPHKGQELIWPVKSQRAYQNFLRFSNRIIIVDTLPTITSYDKLTMEITYEEYMLLAPTIYKPVKMEMRNRFLVNHIDKLIAVWDGSNGGTANCVGYATSMMKEEDITIINPLLYKPQQLNL